MLSRQHFLAAQLGKILEGLSGRSNSLTESKAASGLKEALRIGTDRAVDLTAAPDGYFKNELIKILLPERIRSLEKGLRLAGQGPKIDEFVLSMNRAAEKAAPAARNIFRDALLKMTFTDAKKILTGGETAATDFFKSATSTQLTTAFQPPVESAMAEIGVVQQFKQLSGAAARLPFARGFQMDISNYVVGKALDGLFFMLGQEEKKIRNNPAARLTPLLREVFGAK